MRYPWQNLVCGLALGVVLFTAAGASRAGEQEDLQVITVVAGMKRVLKLTDAQTRQVAGVVQDYFRQVHDQVKDKQLSDAERKRKIKRLRQDMDAQLEHYLTSAQMQLWKSQAGQAQDRAHRGTGDPNGEPSRDPLSQSAAETDAGSAGGRPGARDGVLQSGVSNATQGSGVW